MREIELDRSSPWIQNFALVADGRPAHRQNQDLFIRLPQQRFCNLNIVPGWITTGKLLELLDAENQVIRIRVESRKFLVDPLACPTFSHPQDTADSDQNQYYGQGLLHIAMLVVFERL